MIQVKNDKIRLKLWLKVLEVSRLIQSELRDRFREEFNTTLPRFEVMAALHRHAGVMKMSDLSSELHVSNGNMTGIVGRLVDAGYLSRITMAGDKRATYIELTQKGSDVFSMLATEHEGWVYSLLADADYSDLIEAFENLTLILEERLSLS